MRFVLGGVNGICPTIFKLRLSHKSNTSFQAGTEAKPSPLHV